MVTDQQLHQALSHDPFHQALAQAEASGPQPCPFAVADMLEQLFPNAGTDLPAIWAPTKARATFRPGRSQPVAK